MRGGVLGIEGRTNDLKFQGLSPAAMAREKSSALKRIRAWGQGSLTEGEGSVQLTSMY